MRWLIKRNGNFNQFREPATKSVDLRLLHLCNHGWILDIQISSVCTRKSWPDFHAIVSWYEIEYGRDALIQWLAWATSSFKMCISSVCTIIFEFDPFIRYGSWGGKGRKSEKMSLFRLSNPKLVLLDNFHLNYHHCCLVFTSHTASLGRVFIFSFFFFQFLHVSRFFFHHVFR